jgi:hypothetical protein
LHDCSQYPFIRGTLQLEYVQQKLFLIVSAVTVTVLLLAGAAAYSFFGNLYRTVDYGQTVAKITAVVATLFLISRATSSFFPIWMDWTLPDGQRVRQPWKPPFGPSWGAYFLGRRTQTKTNLVTPFDEAESIAGDLLEEYSVYRSDHQLAAADRWYWRQVLRTIFHLMIGAWRTSTWSMGGSVIVGILLLWFSYILPERFEFAILNWNHMYHINWYRHVSWIASGLFN